MHYLHSFIYFLTNLKESIGQLIQNYGTGTYLILFAIIFCETGLVVTPFLPGDSLLFILGYFAKIGSLNFWTIFLVLSSAAIIGDSVNYWVGYFLGEAILRSKNPWLRKIIKPEYIARTHKFYEKYGKKAIIMARFVPIVRTFNPFIAGFGRMRYLVFLSYDVFGGMFWVLLMSGIGYFLGTIKFVEKHIEVMMIAVIFISVLPMVFEVWAHKREQAREKLNGKVESAVPAPAEEE